MISIGFFQRCVAIAHHRTIALRDISIISASKPKNSGPPLLARSHTNFPPTWATSGSSKRTGKIFSSLFNRKGTFCVDNNSMGYFVIGVSGVTCGGKTTLTKLLLRKFPWARVIHQDHYFYEDDHPQLQPIRVPEAENHVNYEIFESLDMPRMFKEVQAILEAPPVLATPPETKQLNGSPAGVGDKAETPNFDDNFLQQIPNISYDVSKYSKVPILIIEGFTMFASQYLFDACDARLFCSLDKETCRQRRSTRTYFPPDTPSYFEKVVWPEYQKHFDNFIGKRAGVRVFDGNTPMHEIWEASVQIIACRIEEKLANENKNVSSVKL